MPSITDVNYEFVKNSTNNKMGVLLGVWDHENTSPLIKELEKTVDDAEKRCENLVQELKFYKKCCKKYYDVDVSSEAGRKTCRKRKINKRSFKKGEKSKLENVAKVVKNNAVKEKSSKKTDDFYNDMKEKIKEVNKTIRTANEKLGVKNSNVLLSNVKRKSSDCLQNVAVISQQQLKEYEMLIKPSGKVIRKTYLTKPLQRFQLRSKSLPNNTVRKFGFGSFSKILLTCDSSSTRENPPSSRKSRTRDKINHVRPTSSKTKLKALRSKVNVRTTPGRENGNNTNNANLRIKSEIKFEKSKTNLLDRKTVSDKNITIWGPVAPLAIRPISVDVKKPIQEPEPLKTEMSHRLEVTPSTELNKTNLSSSLVKMAAVNPQIKSIIMKPRQIPFTCCKSTSRSFNIGMNIQQVLSLLKLKKLKFEIETPNVPNLGSVSGSLALSVTSLFDRKHRMDHPTDSCPAKHNLTHDLLVSESEERTPDNAWCFDQDQLALDRRPSSRCTCYPSKRFIDYQTLLNQYTDVKRLPERTRKPPTCFTLPNNKMSKITVEDRYSCGDGVHSEINKIHGDLINLHNKYLSLQEQITKQNLDEFEANAEIDAMENEIVTREYEFKDLLSFYNQLMALKKNLTHLREKYTGPNDNMLTKSKRNHLRSTSSMTLTRVLRQIQDMQEKIREINNPS